MEINFTVHLHPAAPHDMGSHWFQARTSAALKVPSSAKRWPHMKEQLKPIPDFREEAEERQFWENHDSSDYVDWNKAEIVYLPNLKPSTKTISIRLPEILLDRIKIEANKRDVPYQSLIKTWLAEKVVSGVNS